MTQRIEPFFFFLRNMTQRMELFFKKWLIELIFFFGNMTYTIEPLFYEPLFQYDSKNWTFLFLRIDFYSMTQRIQFLKKKKHIDAKNWTLLLEYDAKNWSLLLEYDAKNWIFQYDSKNWISELWLKRIESLFFYWNMTQKNWVSFFVIWLKRIELFFEIWLKRIESFFLIMTQKNWIFFLLIMTQENWTLYYHMTQWIEPFLNMTYRI